MNYSLAEQIYFQVIEYMTIESPMTFFFLIKRKGLEIFSSREN